MTVWSWIYLAGWFPMTIFGARLMLGAMARSRGRLNTAAERFGAVGLCSLLAVVWPFCLPAVPFYLFRRLLVTPDERVIAERAELEALREQARKLGLPMPEDSGRISS